MAAPYKPVKTAVPGEVAEESWNEKEPYKFLVQTTVDEDGIYSAVALNLPGTGSCGPTKEVALARFHEAASGMIESYLESGKKIPWKAIKPSETPADAKWISLNV